MLCPVVVGADMREWGVYAIYSEDLINRLDTDALVHFGPFFLWNSSTKVSYLPRPRNPLKRHDDHETQFRALDR